MSQKVVIIGGGAAGFFAAINSAKNNPDNKVIILERSDKLLAKVKISGGGRCNVTNGCFEPKQLVRYYPRGNKELLSAFFRFQPRDTINWFTERDVILKTEDDGRIFPVTNSSQTIIDCFQNEIKKYNIEIQTGILIERLEPKGNGEQGWTIVLKNSPVLHSDKIIVTTGNNATMWNMLAELGYNIHTPVPSLFTFHCNDTRIKDLPGLSVNSSSVSIKNSKLAEMGPLLITHWGFSGPVILRLSAWGARLLAGIDYDFVLLINWTGKNSTEQTFGILKKEKDTKGQFRISNQPLFQIPQRLWDSLVSFSGIPGETKWCNISFDKLRKLSNELTASEFHMTGKSAFKEEFVTCGGIALNQIDFKTMESKRHKNIFFAGEVLDIDALTGGFNFQAAWTTAWIAAQSVKR